MNNDEEIKKLKQVEYSRKYYLKNSEKIKNRVKEYRANNPELIKECKKKHYIENSEHLIIKAKNYYAKNTDIINTKHKEYVAKNSETIKNYQKDYKDKNSETIKNYQKDYKRNRRNTDPIFKMVCNLRSRIQIALKSQGATKDISSKELFGADQEFVWKHLESQFKEGMTRENNNRKGWHIDHIKPMNSFDLNDPEQLKECCHYSNLQPLWWIENLQKSYKYVIELDNYAN